ncbi:sulfatase-like hydrolase/transferase [Actinocorallia sp. A-T 12471]|uniref:sulfatase-like hydrolase/transferase n=1 Tax=Actinocorallia sp. A-T 12471 TaxID=3089813 RepID=UPI0029D1EDD2|nr:sulfatase-like hydrolase/transferase [Actinocorallia sp. A-T 12471]MDX6740353.1 sulfatase-like hydrolase/transferase [Actinocorallia sp. A-T 12471]
MTSGPRNILFLMTDQHRVDTLGCHNPTEVSTPHLDALAASGTRFERAYTPTAICTPARASLLTGKLPFRHKLLANYERNVGYIEDLPADEFTFSAALSDAGYRLGLNGKWHVGTHRNAADFGFEGPDLPGWHNPVDHPDYLKYLSDNGLPPYEISGHVRGTLPNGNPGNLLAARLHQPVEATFEHYLATRTIERLHEYADDYRTGRRPFFLATHFFGPHLPYLLPEEYYDMYDPDKIELPASVAETFEGKPPVQRNYSALWTYDTLSEDVSRKLIAVYRGYVALIDREIGRILDTLHELGLDDSTAVFFTADHGEFTGAHRLHDKGPAMYEDIYRIPAIVRVPGSPAAQVRDEFVGLTDMTATILDLAALDPAQAVDGSTLLPLIAGEKAPWRTELTAEFHGHHFPYPQRMIRDARHKLIINPESHNELYDLLEDPHELTNRHQDPSLATIRHHLTTRLYTTLRDRGDNFHHWMSAMSDTGPLDHDPSLSSFEPNTPTYTPT